MKNNKGITLVSLVITIIVMLILAGVSLSMVVGDNSVLKQASKATISKKLSEIKEEFQVEGLGSSITSYVNRTKRELDEVCVMGDDLEKYIPGIDEVYKEKVAIFNGELVFLKADATEEELQIAQNLGYIMMSDEDYYYMYNMYRLSDYLKAYNEATLPATALGGSNLVEVAGINYGDSWYKVEASQLTELGFSPDDASTNPGKFGSYQPFVVRFLSGEVLSQPGKRMYKDTDKETKIHTFNYKGERDGVVIEGLLAGVNKGSTKTNTQFGAFKAYDGNFSFTGNGGLVFNGGAIGELGINQSVYINKEYTINVTVKCDVDQVGETPNTIVGSRFPDGLASYHRAIIAVSDQSGDYVCWMGVDQGRLRIYSFRRSCNAYPWSTQPYGFMSVDVREYDDKYMNIQFSATKDGGAVLYINGELKETGLAGKENFTYRTLTIGDLRKDRGLKYIGEMHHLLIYGRTLTETEALQNFNAVKKELGF